MWQCYYCRTTLAAELLERNRLCPSCGSDLNCCRNCTHLDASGKCSEPNSPWVSDPEMPNNCPFFEFRDFRPVSPELEPETSLSEVERAKEAFRALFKVP